MKQIFSNEVIENVKVGVNIIEGVGAGFCENETDVEEMKIWMEGVNVGYTLGMQKALEEQNIKEGLQRLAEAVDEVEDEDEDILDDYELEDEDDEYFY